MICRTFAFSKYLAANQISIIMTKKKNTPKPEPVKKVEVKVPEKKVAKPIEKKVVVKPPVVKPEPEIIQVVYSQPDKIVLLNKVFRYGEHVHIGKNVVPVESMGQRGSIGFMLVFQSEQSAKNTFPNEEIIEI